MINLFRHSNPISLLLLVILASFSHFFFPFSTLKLELPQHATMFSSQFNNLFGNFFLTPSLGNGLISTIVILVEAFGLNKILSNLRLFEKSGFIPSLCFVALTNLVPFPYQAEMLFVNGALILSLSYIISSFKKEKANGTILLAGFFAGVAAGFNNNLLFFIWLTISLFAMRTVSIREWLISTIGFLLPYYFMISILYLTNKIDTSLILQIPMINMGMPTLDTIALLRYSSFMGIGAIGVIKSGQALGKMLIHARKTITVTYQLFFVTLISCLISLQLSPYNLFMMTVPVSILITPLFTNYKKPFIPNLVLVLLIVLSMLR